MINKNSLFSYRLWLVLAMFFPMVLWSQTKVQTETKKEIQSDTLIEVKMEAQKEIQPDSLIVAKKKTKKDIQPDSLSVAKKKTKKEIQPDSLSVVKKKAQKDIQPDSLSVVKKEVQKDIQIKDQVVVHPKLLGIGVKSGVTYSTLLVGMPIEQMNGFPEPTYGLIFSYVDQKIVGIQIELNYITKSWEETPVMDTTFNSKLTYLEIPLLTTFHFGNKFKFLVNVGPYLSILLNEESSHSLNETSEYLPYYEKRSPRGGDFGLMGGAGFRLQTKFGLFQVEARYTFGFQNIYDPVKSNLDYSNLTTMGVFLSYQFLFSNDRP